MFSLRVKGIRGRFLTGEEGGEGGEGEKVGKEGDLGEGVAVEEEGDDGECGGDQDGIGETSFDRGDWASKRRLEFL